ncbi:T9SS type A sorting domain-containing protein [Flavobacterium coralii]|uniref:T9SS type A sorting domain-containing protein n=1 Tax=Flavobacterium coralii TaxID=2838017 RepID=UPI000C385D03|nr:hypothetical protein [Flavobacterium sp.]|tara:strand:- start:7998 stop:8681 length:684 start_codon:yes stop_codon:yes gene_type:complete
MKSLFFSGLFTLFLIPYSFSQNIGDTLDNIILDSSFSYSSTDAGNYNFNIETSFSVGAPNICIPLRGTNVSVENDTIYVKIFYDFTGAMFNQGCQREDTINYNGYIPDSVTTLKMSVNAVVPDELNPQEEIIINDVNYQYFNINALNVNMTNQHFNSVFPNPASDKLYLEIETIKEIRLYNISGQLVLQSKNISSDVNVSHLPTGLYLLVIKADDDKEVTEKVVIKH